MFCRVLAVSLGLLLGGAALDSHAGLISLWSFDNSSATSPINANTDIGTQTGSAATLTIGANSTLANAGTTLNDPRSSPSATFSLEFTANNGSFILHLSGANLSGFQVSYAGKIVSGNGGQTWSWST